MFEDVKLFSCAHARAQLQYIRDITLRISGILLELLNMYYRNVI